MTASRRALTTAVHAGQAWACASTGYLLALTALAALGDEEAPEAPPGSRLRFAVLVPAHDEAAGIAPVVERLRTQDYPRERFDVVVIADNCTDATAERARAAGATVWERDAPDDRGKGQALAWAIDRIQAEPERWDAIAVIDADCLASANLLAAFDAHMRRGARAVQAVYDVANPEASPAAALRWAGFALMHRVRPRGRRRLGLSADLFGTGMAFRAELLRAVPWTSFSVVEDAEYHLRLVEAGERVAFVGEASVSSAMPTSHAQATGQQMRWESGNAAVLRRTVPGLVAAGVRQRDLERLHAGLEQLVPPQSALVGANAVLLAAAAALRRRTAVAAGLAVVIGQGLYVLGGLRVAGAPTAVYGALAHAPLLVAAKLPLFARIGSGHGEARWMRTQR
jgi:1,2-diacylglycerol 3-beta-glucosyltransferase